MNKSITYKAFGVRAILMEWPSKIAPEILNEIQTCKRAIQQKFNSDLEDVISGYCSLTLCFKIEIEAFPVVIENIQQLVNSIDPGIKHEQRTWCIPVCYHEKLGWDTQEVCENLKVTAQELIKKHSSARYPIYFIGFLPGFLYLGGLDAKLHLPRKATPRLQVPQGAVAIGGAQTGIYPSASAGGWHIIGKTPIRLFDIENTTPCFAQAGDYIQFEPVSLQEYEHIQNQIKQGNYQLKSQVTHD